MGYVATNSETKEAYYGKGAVKISEIVGCSRNTIGNFFRKYKYRGAEMTFHGWKIIKVEEIKNKNRGSSIRN